MQVGLIEFTLSQQILYANYTFYEMCGYTHDELNGRISDILFVNAPHLTEEKRAMRTKGISDAYDVEIVTKSGEKRWWHISGTPRQNDQLVTISSIGACVDITAQKQLEHELRKAKEAADQSASAKDIFLANMSHEIRTPMNAVFGMARLMEKTELLPQQRFYLETISNATSSLMFIVNDILDFSKISAGKLSLEKVGFYVHDIIKTSIDVIAYRAQEKGLQLIVNPSPCCTDILLGDPFRLKQVLMNLLTNAVKFTAKGSISINCNNNGTVNGMHHLTIQVTDTGRGMDEAFLKILFDKFTQEDESIARSYSGTGLGMSISKHLVELMGGTITVESTKNVGTTFSLNFYFEKGRDTDLLLDEIVQADLSALKNKRILLVEDNEMNQLVAKTLLEQNGLKVWVASNGVEAVSKVKQHDFDLVLMDMQMPVMDGLEATTIIRVTQKDLPIVALSANAFKGERDKCLTSGMNDFLAKPFEEKVLMNLLCKWLDKKKTGIVATEVIPSVPALIAPLAPDTLQDLRSPYNLDQLQAICPGDTAFLHTLIRMFIDDAANTVIKMNEAYKQKDFKAVQSLAHRIKPSINQLKVPYVVQIRRMEELSIAEDKTGELEALLSGFEKIITILIPALEKELQMSLNN